MAKQSANSVSNSVRAVAKSFVQKVQATLVLGILWFIFLITWFFFLAEYYSWYKNIGVVLLSVFVIVLGKVYIWFGHIGKK
ncbi:hypothetical protein ACFL1P_00680 [Patescibacteria group bacterium]